MDNQWFIDGHLLSLMGIGGHLLLILWAHRRCSAVPTARISLNYYGHGLAAAGLEDETVESINASIEKAKAALGEASSSATEATKVKLKIAKLGPICL